MMEQSQCKLTALRALLPFVISMLTAIQAVAADYDFQVGELYYKKLNGGTNVEVISPPSGKYSGDIVVPAEFTIGTTTYKVTAIGENAFKGAEGLTSIKLPDGITTIGGWAFNDCTGLTSFTLPASITSIGEKAFYFCDKLKTLVVESEDPSTYHPGNMAFSKINGSNGNICELIVPLLCKADYNDSYFVHTYGFTYETISECVIINSKTFPDVNFRNWILSQDYGKSGYITAAGLAGVTSMIVSGKNIADLKGIEYFTALIGLNCTNNQLTALDVSKNTALEALLCNNNQLTALDVSNNTVLEGLVCNINQLTALDVSNNTVLIELYCSDNKLTTLDVSKNTALIDLYCYDNKLTTLDVSNNTALNNLLCYGNQIRGTAMQTLINSLHQNGGTLCVYTSAATDGNEINTIQVGEAKVKNWQVMEWDGSNSVDYAGIHAITIDDTNFPDNNFRQWILTQTFADDNYLTDKEAASVTAIDISDKGIADLKGIEHFTALKTLNCSSNQLTTLDVTKYTALTELYCYGNQIRDAGMQTLISSLHQNGGTLCAYATSNENNEMTTTHVADAKAKKWQVKAWDGSKYVDYAGLFAVYINAMNFPDAAFRNYVGDFDLNSNGYLTEDEIVNVAEISVPLKDITSLKGIEYFTALKTLDCNSNKLTALDVSKNTALTDLNCVGNQLSALDLSNCPTLYLLDCSYNKLTTLDVSKNTELQTLYCENNQLTALNVTKNTSLSELYCHGNKITTGMQELINSLHQNGGALYGYSSENDGNKITTEQVTAADFKGWMVFMWDGANWVPYPGMLLGDANGDNKVDVADIVAIVSHQKGQDVNGFSLPAADVDYDGKADGKDIALIRKMIMGE